MHPENPVLVSACLVGLATRYDGLTKTNAPCIERLAGTHFIPVCPEQLGGLPTPRCPAEIVGGNGTDVLEDRATVTTAAGDDVTSQFIKGACMVLEIAEQQAVSACYLKARSPSCGVTKLGVTAALLASKGYSVEEFD